MKDASRLPPSEIIKAQRKRRCWTQEQLAEALGTSAKNVGRWERGETSPSPYYCQRLCEVFGVSPWELGLLEADPLLQLPVEPDTDSAGRGRPFHEAFLPKRTSWRVALAILFLLVVIVGLFGLSKFFATPAYAHIKPGGSWISPMNGQMVSGVIHFAAYAYPTNPGDPAIDHVNFTMWWQGVDPRRWVIACTIHAHSSKDVFSCDVNLAQLGAVAGPIRISFDVYDRNGNYNKAPNGVHAITYFP